MWPAQHYYSTKDTITGKFKPHKLKGEEIGYVDQVTLVGAKDPKTNIMRQQANIRMRYVATIHHHTSHQICLSTTNPFPHTGTTETR